MSKQTRPRRSGDFLRKGSKVCLAPSASAIMGTPGVGVIIKRTPRQDAEGHRVFIVRWLDGDEWELASDELVRHTA